MRASIAALILAMASMANPATGNAEQAREAGHITGVGGIFFKSKDPKALAAWYRDVLGIAVEQWGGAALRYDAPGHPPVLVWNAFPENSDYFAPSTQSYMMNFAVDDMDAFIARLQKNHVAILKRVDDDPNGRFAWILDPEGTKIELWEPARSK